jgi:peptidoglycan hydrolase-like protein with peptidoglycan-binding domain
MKLQIFLNAVGIVVPITSVFDEATDQAVRTFQLKYLVDVLTPWDISEATGYVYKTTRAKINNMVCPGSEAVPQL